VVASTVKRRAWSVLVGLALIYIVALAFTGERPGPGLARFEPKGLMRHIPIDSVNLVEVTADTRQWRFERASDGTWRATPTVARLNEGLFAALTLLHNSAPERILAGRELSTSSLVEFDLEKPRLRIAVHSLSAEPFVITFGGANALGSVRYARVDGHDDVALLPAFTAEAWEHLAGKQ
jgi:hypothetical protein